MWDPKQVFVNNWIQVSEYSACYVCEYKGVYVQVGGGEWLCDRVGRGKRMADIDE